MISDMVILSYLGGFVARCGCNAASATTCDAIVLCVAANLGPGLRYDAVTGDLAVRISGDAGNAARFGSDMGIYVPGGDTNPDPTSGRKTVAGLGARIVGATQGGAGSMLPFGAPQSVEYGVANQLDFISFHTFALQDGVAVNRWSAPSHALNTYTDNPSNIQANLISSLQLPFLNVDAGTRDSPTGRNSGAPSPILSPDGGWFGFYAPQFAPTTLAEALWQLAARSVALILPFGSLLEEEVARGLDAVVRAVVQTLAQDWTMVGIPAYISNPDGDDPPVVKAPLADWVDSVTGAGLIPMVDLFDEKVAAEAPGARWTPAEILATGAAWVRVQSPIRSSGLTQERIEELIDAGFDVIAQTSGRQWETTQMFDLGVRGIMSDSAVYSRGVRGEAGDLDYRRRRVIPGLTTRTTAEGAFTRLTDDGISTGSGETGYARQSATGRYFPARFDWEGGIGKRLHSQLLGELCPHEFTDNYDLRMRFRFDPQQTEHPYGSAPKLGVFFASPTDRNITHASGVVEPHINGYWFYVIVGTQQQGEIKLGKFNDGVFSFLDQSLSLPSIALNSWIYFHIQVRNPTLTLTVGHSTLPPGEPEPQVSIDDTDHRGAYTFYGWEDDYALPADNQGFAHGYDAYQAFATSQPMYAAIPAGA